MNKYLNIFEDEQKETTLKNTKIDNYLNKDLNEVKNKTKGIKKLIIGNGSKVINQYPEKDAVLDTNETLILLTNSDENKLPDLKGYSKLETKAVCNMLNIKCTFKGYGYVNKQNIKNKKIKEKEKVTFELK